MLLSAKRQVLGKQAPFRLTVSRKLQVVEDGDEPSTPSANC